MINQKGRRGNYRKKKNDCHLEKNWSRGLYTDNSNDDAHGANNTQRTIHDCVGSLA